MYTQCPECLTIYLIAPEALAQARGSVSCSHCTAVFDALRTLTDNLPIGAQRLASHESDASVPDLVQPVMRPIAAANIATHAGPAAAPTPEFARTHPAPSARSNRIWKGGIAILAPLLLAQIAWAERTELLQNPTSRAWLERGCSLLHCTLPVAHDAENFVLLSRDVRPHPSVPNALIISATLRNDADVAQAFPIVEITLTDLDEQRIAMRRFKPSEYLGDVRTLSAGLAAHASTALVFEVADPGKNAVAYEFKFL
ncbi:MAG: zinc-ribbon and DUF3426 domain-containing protein [Rudaea sp.]|uniref:zinc-ribbon and DUF3426 domain-containing protein n=1 Tax=unclassified Rudaea TaxID=2627037 RepID=UPI0010F7E825|nr:MULTISPECIES: zinc-ribbon and DUF3426 domain-containing protein [unclassified Rudaea]MBN8886054.1 zinc-ribbon and DUF3426 domain-containing protein [Rudaea sp.]MBR0346618.1 zinc-ribbon and DUF3426 domain-containing protein [Rudaea sp.]